MQYLFEKFYKKIDLNLGKKANETQSVKSRQLCCAKRIFSFCGFPVRFIGQGNVYTVLVNKNKPTHERKTHMEIRVTSKTVREGLLGMAKGFFYTSGVVAVLTLICRLVA